ncbi:MAG: hypothetical protein R6U19_04445, partial [Bacteroidales bacterium]
MSDLIKLLPEVVSSDALHAFRSLDVTTPSDGDRYFEVFGVGNTLERVDRPFERFICYEFMLNELRNADAAKFNKIHKGTPYYYLAWTAFDLGNYSK